MEGFLPGNPEPQLGDSENPEPQRGASGNREPPLGASHHLGWYKRFLPHRDDPRLLQFITYRLADSLPGGVLDRIAAEVENLPPERREAERRKRMEHWLDAGHGLCVLREPEAARCVVETWKRFDGDRYDLVAWVVMPNHVHVLIRTVPGTPLGKIVQSWKSYTGRWIRERIEPRAGDGMQPGGGDGMPPRAGDGMQPRAGARGSQERGSRARGSQGLWMREYWDRYIRDEKHFVAVTEYIHINPVKAGLVKRARDWPWSSAAEYAETE